MDYIKSPTKYNKICGFKEINDKVGTVKAVLSTDQ